MSKIDPSDLILEAVVDSHEAAQEAVRAGAGRIELCSRLDLGGVSPHVRTIRSCMKAISVPLKIMVRPRGGDFVYSSSEISQMEKEIAILKRFGIEEVVLGCLTPEGKVDVEATNHLADSAYPMRVTFHKAIDVTPDPLEALETLKGVRSVTAILTSGGAPTALEGQENIRKMIASAGERFPIISAGKITWLNLPEVHAAIGGKEYHGRKIVNTIVMGQATESREPRRGRR
ncbi:MAG: copper homeostasis protein CutC [Bacteroidia bacterium]|nr:copper homeostasis protein CutC [Bacteroidia bacterium]